MIFLERAKGLEPSTPTLARLYSTTELHPQKKERNDKTKMAGVTGLEPATSCVTGKRSNQLSYTPKQKQCFFNVDLLSKFFKILPKNFT